MENTTERKPHFVTKKVEEINLGSAEAGTREVLLNSAYTGGDVYLVDGRMPPGSGVPLHIHEHEDEIFHVLEGQVVLQLGDQEYHGKAGDIVYLPRKVQHAIRAEGDTAARVLNYVIPGKNFETFFNAMHLLPANASQEEKADLARKHGITFL